MSAALLSSLPGDIPGLLRYTSPVRDQRHLPGLVFEVCGAFATVGYEILGSLPVPLGGLRLDLTDATGRTHATWWARMVYGGPLDEVSTRADVARVCRLAARGASMTPEQIDLLARFCLRLAGRAS